MVRRRRILGVLTLMAVLGGSCLVPSGTPKNIWNFETPDPAAEPVPGGFQVYTTNNFWYKVPTFTTGWPSGNSFAARDALADRPAWSPPVAGAFIWAPTVRFLAGRYLMMFTASVGNHSRSACIGAATSSNVSGPFQPTSFQLCDPNPAVGYLDPYIFREGGEAWLLWSRQWNGGSEIVIQKLTSNGLGVTGTRYRLLTFAEAVSISPGGLGSNPFVENPALVKDPYNGYDLLVSLGTWSDPNYRTVELPCLNKTGNCLPSEGGAISNMMGGNLTGRGGASLVFDNSPTSNVMVFHAFSGTQRWSFAMDTAAVDLTSTVSKSAQATEGQIASDARASAMARSIPVREAPAITATERVKLLDRCPECNGGRRFVPDGPVRSDG